MCADCPVRDWGQEPAWSLSAAIVANELGPPGWPRGSPPGVAMVLPSLAPGPRLQLLQVEPSRPQKAGTAEVGIRPGVGIPPGVCRDLVEVSWAHEPGILKAPGLGGGGTEERASGSGVGEAWVLLVTTCGAHGSQSGKVRGRKIKASAYLYLTPR